MKTVEVLKAARELIATPEMWCQGAIARDSLGNGVHSDDDIACKWCVAGAINKVSNGHGVKAHFAIQSALGLWGGVMWIGDWNDSPHRTHAEVLAAFDKAIQLEELSNAPA